MLSIMAPQKRIARDKRSSLLQFILPKEKKFYNIATWWLCGSEENIEFGEGLVWPEKNYIASSGSFKVLKKSWKCSSMEEDQL
jgi:hypothetical protein